MRQAKHPRVAARGTRRAHDRRTWVRWLRRAFRPVWVAIGFVLIAIGLVGAFLPTHLLGGLLMLGLILVLRNSMRWRRRFIRLQRRHPRYVYPLRRLLRGEVWPVIWHELLRSELVLPRRWRRLRRWRARLKRGLR